MSSTEEFERNEDSMERKKLLSETRQKIPAPSLKARESTKSNNSVGETIAETNFSSDKRNGYMKPSPEKLKQRESSLSFGLAKPPLRRLV